MRAVLIPADSLPRVGEEFAVVGERAHHLAKVVRARPGEEVALLNGEGLKALGEVCAVGKEAVSILVKHVATAPRNDLLQLAIALPKKEAFEEAMRAAVECGIARVIPLETEYSQRETRFNERLERVIESALIQSNNLYFPQILPLASLEELGDLAQGSSGIYFFDSQGEGAELQGPIRPSALMLVGPEGGFSAGERKFIAERLSAHPIHLETSILRTPTAVAVGAGYLLGRMRDGE